MVKFLCLTKFKKKIPVIIIMTTSTTKSILFLILFYLKGGKKKKKGFALNVTVEEDKNKNEKTLSVHSEI